MVAYEVRLLHENLFLRVMELFSGCLLIYGGKQLPRWNVSTGQLMYVGGLQMSFNLIVLRVDASKGPSTIMPKGSEGNIVGPDVARE